jgi:soluble lytic murein transglycosylase-like protein
MVQDAGSKHGVDPSLGLAVISAESSFNAMAVSKDGHNTKGLFQLKDTTGTEVLTRIGLKESYDPFDPRQNVEVGVGYLRYLHDIFNGSTALPNNAQTVPASDAQSLEQLAVAAFNAGEGRIASAQQRALRAGLDPSKYEDVEAYLPESTRAYVRKVMTTKQSFDTTPVG